MKDRHFLLILIWFPFVFSVLIICYFFVKYFYFSPKPNFSTINTSKYERLLGLNFPVKIRPTKLGFSFKRLSWNPFLGHKVNQITAKDVRLKKIVVTAILNIGNNMVCIVNGKETLVGKKIGDVVVSDIVGSQVFLILPNGKRVKLNVGQEFYY